MDFHHLPFWGGRSLRGRRRVPASISIYIYAPTYIYLYFATGGCGDSEALAVAARGHVEAMQHPPANRRGNLNGSVQHDRLTNLRSDLQLNGDCTLENWERCVYTPTKLPTSTQVCTTAMPKSYSHCMRPLAKQQLL